MLRAPVRLTAFAVLIAGLAAPSVAFAHCQVPCGIYGSREARGSSAEVDFLVAREGKVVPIEVKSGAGGSLRSLHLLLATYPSCPEGIVLSSGTFAHRPEQRLTFMPLYYAGSLGDLRPDVA